MKYDEHEITYSLRDLGEEFFCLNVIKNGKIVDFIYGKLKTKQWD